MNKVFLLCLMVLGYSVHAQTASEKQEDSAYATLEQVPEVQHMIQNDTDKRWTLMMRTIQRPTRQFKYYWIEVGHQNADRFVTQFHFYIQPPKMDVFYKDPLTDSLYTPEKWRAAGK